MAHPLAHRGCIVLQTSNRGTNSVLCNYAARTSGYTGSIPRVCVTTGLDSTWGVPVQQLQCRHSWLAADGPSKWPQKWKNTKQSQQHWNWTLKVLYNDLLFLVFICFVALDDWLLSFGQQAGISQKEGNGHYTIYILFGAEGSPMLGQYRHGWIKVKNLEQLQANAATITSAISNLCTTYLVPNSNRQVDYCCSLLIHLQVHKEPLAARPATEYRLSFSLLNANPKNTFFTWDFRAASQSTFNRCKLNSNTGYLEPFLDSLSPIAKFTVDSQVHMRETPITESRFFNTLPWPQTRYMMQRIPFTTFLLNPFLYLLTLMNGNWVYFSNFFLTPRFIRFFHTTDSQLYLIYSRSFSQPVAYQKRWRYQKLICCLTDKAKSPLQMRLHFLNGEVSWFMMQATPRPRWKGWPYRSCMLSCSLSLGNCGKCWELIQLSWVKLFLQNGKLSASAFADILTGQVLHCGNETPQSADTWFTTWILQSPHCSLCPILFRIWQIWWCLIILQTWPLMLCSPWLRYVRQTCTSLIHSTGYSKLWIW